MAGEREASYEIEFHYGKLAKRATIPDLRLEVDGRVAQMDHLIIDRLLTIWVRESKHFAEGVAVNDYGEWSRSWTVNHVLRVHRWAAATRRRHGPDRTDDRA